MRSIPVFHSSEEATKSSILFRDLLTMNPFWTHLVANSTNHILKKVRKTHTNGHQWKNNHAFSLRNKFKLNNLLVMAVFYNDDKLRCIPKTETKQKCSLKKEPDSAVEMANNNNKWKRHSIKMYRMYKHKHSSPCNAMQLNSKPISILSATQT